MSLKSRIESSVTPMAEAVSDRRDEESASVGGELETSEKETSVSKVSLVVGDRVTAAATGDAVGRGTGA